MPNMYTPCDEVEFKLNRAIEEEARSGRAAMDAALNEWQFALWEDYIEEEQEYLHACALTDDARRDYDALPGVKHAR